MKWVYDISQTDAKAEPTPAVNRDERQLLSALIAKRPVPIELSDTIENGAVYDHTQKKIFVRKGMEAPDIFRSLSFALARAEMANDTRNFSNENADFKAYCASYMLCRKYGIDVSGYDFREMPDVGSAEPQAIRGELSEIRDVMRTMSARMYKAMEQNRLIFAASSARTIISHSPDGLSLVLRRAQYTTPYLLASATKRFISSFLTENMESSLPLLSIEVRLCLPLILFLSRFLRAATSFAALPVILAATSTPSRLNRTTCSAASPDGFILLFLLSLVLLVLSDGFEFFGYHTGTLGNVITQIHLTPQSL